MGYPASLTVFLLGHRDSNTDLPFFKKKRWDKVDLALTRSWFEAKFPSFPPGLLCNNG